MGCMSGSETLTDGDSEASACNKAGSASAAAIADLLEMVGVTGIESVPKAVDGRRKSWARAVPGGSVERAGACQSAAGILLLSAVSPAESTHLCLQSRGPCPS